MARVDALACKPRARSPRNGAVAVDNAGGTVDATATRVGPADRPRPSSLIGPVSCVPFNTHPVASCRGYIGGFASLSAIFFGCTSGFFGTTSVSTPSFSCAAMCSKSAPSGRVKLRVNCPKLLS